MYFYASLSLICALLKKEEVTILAKAVLDAQEIREESWDPLKSCYLLNNEEAAMDAVNWEVPSEENKMIIVNFIASANDEYWNDIQWWAEATLEEK